MAGLYFFVAFYISLCILYAREDTFRIFVPSYGVCEG